MMPQQMKNDQESMMRSQPYNNGGNQDPSEPYEDQRQRAQMIDKIMLEQDNNTTGKRIRKFNVQRPLPTSGQVGYDDESGPEGIDDVQLKEIKKLNK
jgi:hypothetical protein